MTLVAQSEDIGAGVIQTPHLGRIVWDSGSELYLPLGLPGFERERRLVPVEIPAHRPLLFLQSVQQPDLCFVSLPVTTICPEYDLRLNEDDRAALLLPEEAAPSIGADVLCIAILLPCGATVEVNLDAPIVINLHNSRCVQSVGSVSRAGYYRLSDDGRWEKTC